MQDLKKWKILKSTIVFNHQWCKVRQDEIELPNGKVTEEIDVVLIPIEAAIEKITTGEICVAGTVAAIFIGLNFLSNRA